MTEKIKQALSQFADKISEQVWFQQIKTKWEEIDAQSRTYLKMAGVAVGGLIVLSFVFSSVMSVRALKKEFADKNDLILLIQSANEELRGLRTAGMSASGDEGAGALTAYFNSSADRAGVDQTKMTLGTEKPALTEKAQEKTPDKAKESLIDISLQKVNIKQLVRFAFYLENGTKPVKVRNLSIDTEPDLSGYLNATLSVSAFTIKQ